MTLAPHINEFFSGAIWRMEIDGKNGIIALEIRNNENKTVSFASISINSGKVYFKAFTTPERWLAGIETIFDGVLLIHYYQSEAGPAHKGLQAINAISGETLWNDYNHAFDHLTAEGPLVYDVRVQPRRLFLLDVKTGATTRIYPPSVYKDADNAIAVPRDVPIDNVDTEFLPVHPYGNTIHYHEYNNFRIVSLHALKSGELMQALYVFNEQGTMVYQDLLNTGIQKIQPEAFIMHHNHLIYIKNRVELKALSI